jgi:type IV pilus assembly protein PilB
MDKKKSIGELLVEYGMITVDDLDEGLKRQKEMGMRLGETLIQLGKVRREDIEWILSKQLDIPFVMVEDVTVDAELLNKFPRELLIKNHILPLYEDNIEVAVAAEDPLNQEAFGQIERISGKRVLISSGNGEKILSLLKEFYHKGVVSDLRETIGNLLGKMKNTSFYRIDFLFAEQECGIAVFGFGLLKKAASLKGSFQKDQVYNALASLNIPFLYQEQGNDAISFVSVYPLVHRTESISMPAVLGMFGLVVPDGTAFADTPARGLPSLFSADLPVKGYPYIAVHAGPAFSPDVIFTVDTVPRGLQRIYVKAFLPDLCSSCKGAGCAECNQFGYTFLRQIDGYFSSDEIISRVDEVRSWQR